MKAAELPTYEALADAKWKGRICMRSSTNMYNLSLLGAMIDHLGEQKAQAWAQAVRDNLAREPKGGDTDQLKSVAAGECDVTIPTSIIRAPAALGQNRRARGRREDRRGVPEPTSWGTHEHLRAGVMKRAEPRSRGEIPEYLASDEAQRYFADGNNEWPAVASVKVDNRCFSLRLQAGR